jgi:iron complex transport system permease protein
MANSIRLEGDKNELTSVDLKSPRASILDPRSRNIIILAILLPIIYILGVIQPSMMWVTEYDMTIAKYFTAMLGDAKVLFGVLGGDDNFVMGYILTQFIMAGIVGACLATAGCVYQGAFQNGLASPSTLGVQSGGVVFGTIFVLCFYGTPIFSKSMLTLSIFIGAILMVCVILLLAKVSGGGQISNITMVLSGMIFAGGLSEVTGIIQYLNLSKNTFSDQATILRYMMMGTFDYVQETKSIFVVGIPLLLVLLIVFMFRSKLNALGLGAEEAKSLGVNVSLTRNMMIGTVTIMTALIISNCGMINFVGFIIPHLARRLVGPDFKWLLPASMLIGADFMMIVFAAGRISGYGSNINFMTSLIGGIAFLIFFIYHRKKGTRGGF